MSNLRKKADNLLSCKRARSHMFFMEPSSKAVALHCLIVILRNCKTDLIFQLNHLWYPVILLGIVECDTLSLEVGDCLVLPPGGGVARAPQEYVVGGGGGALGTQLTTLTTFVRYLGHLQKK